MVQIKIQIESFSGERSDESEDFSSSDIQVSTDLNILELQSNENYLIAPFVMKIKYTPPVGRITLKGKAKINGKKDELKEIREKQKNNETPPEKLVQEILKQNLVEAAIISKTLNVPTPIPLPRTLKNSD